MSTENQNIETFEEPFLQKMQYGAPELLRTYKKFLTISLLLTFVLFTSGIAGYGVSIIIVDKNKQVKTTFICSNLNLNSDIWLPGIISI